MSSGQCMMPLCALAILLSAPGQASEPAHQSIGNPLVAATYGAMPRKVPDERREPVPLIAPELWITVTDYPMHAALDGLEADVETELTVAEDGRVSECVIISSSGDALLDSKTCKLLVRRARFKPALDDEKRPITGVYRFSHSWRIPPSRGLSDARKSATQYSRR
ncbi:energy transducer TonB [Alterisphingorhabdus coralli]|uniref:Energy transducer TonB n=1 Tax=Alterisphingorhabdus coralli TaxID=3071408 RepID=A0AA97FCA1_9SPHN|nr:energy transducer TonB [Parasphingorhabdus sp. SCSIO 66989]WOE76420.1 energy transducer TonB [Parasphingorhabdus sp. SCSIO 66989]